jgi:hypothetical protein
MAVCHVCGFLAEGLILRDGQHGSWEVAMGACNRLQDSFYILWRYSCEHCAMQGGILLSSPDGLRLCLNARTVFVLAVESSVW